MSQVRACDDLTSICLRPMRESDLDAVMDIELRAYPFPWSRGIFRDCLQSNYAMWLQERADGAILGYGVLSIAAGEAHVLNLCSAPGQEGQGLGQRMLQTLLKIARGHAAQRVFLEVRPSNTRAIALYERSGFNEIGRRPRYYPAANNGREDAIVMALELLD
ncbi:MAG TPA: ribosomal protein S18-alanine N-acetyltransferase [Thermomonas sp.]|jgi:ribosomal-protein-alanine N-acetyltransferase|nr:ribosomal protein S18-alanine N-acetyltransferase [Thermomonas sp.]HRA56376.1 ribosomal protein S18-alanine N-acetyltransferase [Thermomonas sp.]